MCSVALIFVPLWPGPELLNRYIQYEKFQKNSGSDTRIQNFERIVSIVNIVSIESVESMTVWLLTM